MGIACVWDFHVVAGKWKGRGRHGEASFPPPQTGRRADGQTGRRADRLASPTSGLGAEGASQEFERVGGSASSRNCTYNVPGYARHILTLMERTEDSIAAAGERQWRAVNDLDSRRWRTSPDQQRTDFTPVHLPVPRAHARGRGYQNPIL
jgi:hypothetical protein